MTDEDMIDDSMDDPDARPMTEQMLATVEAQHRLRRSKARRVAASKALVEALAENEANGTPGASGTAKGD